MPLWRALLMPCALGSVFSSQLGSFVRAYQLPDRLLVLVLNDRSKPQQVVLGCDLSLWLPNSTSFEVKHYDAQGALLGNSSAEGTHWVAVTNMLRPGAISAFELRSR